MKDADTSLARQHAFLLDALALIARKKNRGASLMVGKAGEAAIALLGNASCQVEEGAPVSRQ